MDKRHNNKKHSKNKHNNKRQNQKPSHKSQNRDDTATDKLSSTERNEVWELVNLLLKDGLFDRCVNAKEEWRQYETVQDILSLIIQLEEPLQRKQADQAIGISNRLENIDKFYQWAFENGIQSNGVVIHEFPSYDLGLLATDDVKKDEIIFTVPRRLMLSEENMHCEYVKQCLSLSNIRLAFTLMVESLKADSFWKPYIDILPDKYNTVLYYSTSDMAELKGSNALSTAINMCQIIASLYVNISNWPESALPIKGFKEMFSYNLLRWAVSTVMTRENFIPRSNPSKEGSEIESISALIPFWDMANHKQGIITSFYQAETEEMESAALEDFKKGEQIFMHYGSRTNAEFMIHNGFINPANPTDHVCIKLGLCISDPLFLKRIELLQLLDIPKNSKLIVLLPPEHISPQLLGFVRVFNMNHEQLDHWINSDRATDLLHIDCALETELESKAWQYLQIRLMLLLKVFPTTLEDDEKLFEGLKSGTIKPKKTYIQTMILEYRILEKRILTAALEYVKQRSKS